MKILHTEPLRYEPEVKSAIERAGEVEYVPVDTPEGLIAALERAPYDALFARIGLSVDARAFAACPSLRFVVTPTTGLDHIDLVEAGRRGARVISLRGETEFLEKVSATSELTWGLLLAAIRRIPAAHRDVVSGHWRRNELVGEELDGKTLGILGLGRLGRKVARYGVAFGMRVVARDVDPTVIGKAPAGVEMVDIDTLLRASDVLSVHLPLKADTERYMDTSRIARMKTGAVLVNTSRGEIVDETALLSALQRGHLSAAALDVMAGDSRWDEKVSIEAHPLVTYARTHDNLVLTPHIGGYARSSINATRRFVTERFLAIAAEGVVQ